MPLTGFTFNATHTDGNRTLSPVINTLRTSDQREKGRVFTRRILETPLIFKNGDFDYLKDIRDGANSCDKVNIDIDLNGNDYLDVFINVNKPSEWDDAKCIAEFKAQTSDDYTCLFEEWETQYNILSFTPKVTVNGYAGTIVQATCTLTNQANPFATLEPPCGTMTEADGWTLIRNEGVKVSSSPVLWDITKVWAREEIITACVSGLPSPPAGSNWVLVDNDCGGSGNSTYAREVPRTYNYDQSYGSQGSGEDWLYVWDISGTISNTTPESYDNGVELSTILPNLLSSCSLTVESDFLSINPPRTNPSNDAYIASNPNLVHLVFFQKTDIKTPSAFQNASQGFLTLKELLEWLENMFNARWWIDGTVLRIEHVSGVSTTQGLDLTIDHSEAVLGLNKYSVQDADLPRYDVFTWMDETNDPDFKGRRIIYPLSCSSDEQADYPVNRVTTDIEGISANPANIVDDGFVILSTDLDLSLDYYIISEVGEISNNLRKNGHLSWANLHENYHTWDRAQLNGSINGVSQTFDSSKRTKIEDSLSIKVSPEYYRTWDASELVNSNIGWGQVEPAEYDAATCTLTLNLSHEQ